MCTTLQPREVDKPFLWRWSRMALELVVHSPVRFGLVVALPGSPDTWAVNVAHEYVLPHALLVELGVGLLPALWTLVAALARSADKSLDVQQTVEFATAWLGSCYFLLLLHGAKAPWAHPSGIRLARDPLKLLYTGVLKASMIQALGIQRNLRKEGVGPVGYWTD